MNVPVFQLLINERQSIIALLILIIIAIIFLFFIDPNGSSIFPPCTFYRLTGLYCPGCGSLRCLHQFLHGHLQTGFKLNPLMVLSLPFLGYAFISRVIFVIRGKPFPNTFIPAFWIWLLLGFILAFWVVRNTPYYPFSSFLKNFK